MFDIGHLTKRVTDEFRTVAPTKIAIRLEDQQYWTYHDLHVRSNAYANALKVMGVKKGDRVGVLLYNCLEYFGLYFAIAKIGAIAVRINFRLSAPEYEYILEDSGTKILCYQSDLNETMAEIRKNATVQEYICFSQEDAECPEWAVPQSQFDSASIEEIEDVAVTLEDPVMLMYTSGTTGLPKGAVWTHGNTLWFSTMQAMKWNYTGEEVAMTTGPLYHVGAMEDIALPTLLRGGTVHITKSKGFNISRVLSVIATEKVTDCFLFPFMIYEMLQSPLVNKLDLRFLKRIYTGGDPIMPWAIEKLNERFPDVGLIQVYGLTEGTPIACSLDPKDNRTKSHTVGKPLPLTEIQVVNEEQERVPTGKVGEILIKSPVVSKAYWNKPAASAETFVNGWCKTGDYGVIDEHGFLTMAGRKKDMIRSGGENIYAPEIEDLLYRHNDIREVSIIGIPDLKYIETVCAIVVKKPGSDLRESDVIDFCINKIAKYKQPKKVKFVKELPRTPSGKVQKYKLREQYGTLTKLKGG